MCQAQWLASTCRLCCRIFSSDAGEVAPVCIIFLSDGCRYQPHAGMNWSSEQTFNHFYIPIQDFVSMPLPFLYAFIYVYAYMYIYIYNPILYPHTGLCVYESGGKACQILSVNAT